MTKRSRAGRTQENGGCKSTVRRRESTVRGGGTTKQRQEHCTKPLQNEKNRESETGGSSSARRARPTRKRGQSHRRVRCARYMRFSGQRQRWPPRVQTAL